jgi:flagellar biosynthesis protein FliR
MLGIESSGVLLLVFIRLLAIITCLPAFGYSFWEWRLKMVFALLISLMLLPAIANTGVADSWFEAICAEAILGIVFGFSLQLLMQLLALLGRALGAFSGFAFSNLIEPVNGLPETTLMQLFYLSGVFMFFQLDMHHLVIQGLKTLFENFPLGGSVQFSALIKPIVTGLLEVANKLLLIGMPLVMMLLVVLMGIALLARYKFELNLLTVGLPLLSVLFFIVLYLKFDNFCIAFASLMQNFITGLYR